MVLMVLLASLAVGLLLHSPSALAWGGLGHEAICELAFRELDDTARERVSALIRQDPEFTTLRASCNWADKPRQRASEHFVSLPHALLRPERPRRRASAGGHGSRARLPK
jgi:hypothetical protein